MSNERGDEATAVPTVDAYLAQVPPGPRAALERLRRTIRTVAPDAEEVISYGIPTFRWRGALVGFGAFKDHCGFYVMSPAVMDDFADELQGFDTAKATIRFAAGTPLPAALVKKLVKARMAENTARGAR